MPSDFDLQTLDAEPPTPSRVDVERAIADGRRRRTRRGAGYAGAATLTVVAVVGASVAAGGFFTDARPSPEETAALGASEAPAPPAGCAIDRLPVPDDAPMALASGADPTGRYIVGRSYPKSGGYQAVIWQDGKATKVMMPGDLEESLQDVNSTGTAVGWSYQDTGPVPYVYRDGKVSQLPGVHRGSALAVNDAGAIVGDDADGTALLWRSATAEPTRLPLPAGASKAGASDIDEDGTVVGNIDMAKPYVWLADGTHRELPLPKLDEGQATTGRVFTVRNGWATGWAGVGGDKRSGAGAKPTSVRWNLRTGEVRVFDQINNHPSTANAQGWQIGSDEQGRAVLVTDAATVVLPGLVGREPGGMTVTPNALSDDGRTISGQADDATGTIQAVVWRCR